MVALAAVPEDGCPLDWFITPIRPQASGQDSRNHSWLLRSCAGMQRVQGLLRSVDRVQQRSRWLGFPLAVTGKFRDDHGGTLTTVIACNASFAFFPLLLVVVTVFGSCSAATPASSSGSSARRWPTSPSSVTKYRTTSTGCAAAASAW
jgi:hypothetical protein